MNKIVWFPLSAEKMRDDKRAQIARPYLDYLFAYFAFNGNVQWYDGDHEITKRVQLSGADVSLICKHTHVLRYAEVKTDFHLPYNLCLETISNTKVDPPIPGWMVTAYADRLVISFVWLDGVLDVFVIVFPALKEWFWGNGNHLNFHKHVVQGSNNCTESRIVPVTKVIEHVSTHRYLVTQEGRIFSVPLSGQDTIDIARRVLQRNGVPYKRIASKREASA